MMCFNAQYQIDEEKSLKVMMRAEIVWMKFSFAYWLSNQRFKYVNSPHCLLPKIVTQFSIIA